jgi:tetratricopeptide (TPR) repeat protein
MESGTPSLPDELQQKMRASVRVAAGRLAGAVRTGAHPTLTAVLCAAACSPLIAAAVGTGGVATAALGVLGGLGSGALTNVVSGVIERFRHDRSGEYTSAVSEALLARQLDEVIDADSEQAANLRQEVAAILAATGAMQAVTDAAVQAGDEAILREMQTETERFTEFRADFDQALDRLARIEGLSEEILGCLKKSGGAANAASATRPTAFLTPMSRVPFSPTRGMSPASLLRADVGTIAFHGRTDQLRRLSEWCAGSGLGVLLLTGPGGVGKSRLARQLAQVLETEGWMTGGLAPQVDPSSILDHLDGLQAPLLVVVDYAETRPEQVKDLIAAAHGGTGDCVVRILLLARTEDEWWQQAVSEVPRDLREVMVAAQIQTVPLLTLDEREAIFSNAVQGLAGRVQGTLPDEVRVPDLSHQRFGSPLQVALEALALLLESDVHNRSTNAEYLVLDHERPYWSAVAAEHRLALEPQDQLISVAAAALCGAANRAEALALLRRLDGLGDDSDDGHRRRVRTVRWLHDLYTASVPEPGQGPRSYWGTLQPDLIAEHLIAAVVQENPEFLPRILAEPSAAQAEQALFVLSRAAIHHPAIAKQVTDLLTGQLHLVQHATKVLPRLEDWTLMESALLAAIRRIPRLHESLDMLWSIAKASSQRSHHLRRVRREALQAICMTHLANGIPDTVEEVESLSVAAFDLAGVMTLSGQIEFALQSLLMASQGYERLAAHEPGRFRPSFAKILTALASELVRAGRPTDASATIDRALAISKDLVAEDAHSHEILFASTLAQSAVIFPVSRVHEGLTALKQAVSILENRGCEDLEAQIDLRAALHDMSVLYATAERHNEALSAAERAVTIANNLVEKDRETYLPGLARSLYTLTAMLAQRQEHQKALETAEKAYIIWLDLTRSDNHAFGLGLMHLMLLLGFLRHEANQPGSAADPLIRVLQFVQTSPLARLVPDDDSTTYHVARSLQTAYRHSPEEVEAHWREIMGGDPPVWLRDGGNGLLEDEISWYRYTALIGDTHAARYLSHAFYRYGDPAQAEIWTRKSADAGDVASMTRLGHVLRRRGRLRDAEPWWRKAAEQGDVDAMVNLAMALMMRAELREAEHWAEMATHYGSVRGMNVLGAVSLSLGKPDIAETWYRQAGRLGDPNASDNLHSLLEAKDAAGEGALEKPAHVQWR